MNSEHSLSYFSSEAERRTDAFITFSIALAQSEMQTASSRIWTWFSDLISHDNNRYAKW